eukprot:jgi/Bigna1/73543/fgenesh1_pg.24_\
MLQAYKYHDLCYHNEKWFYITRHDFETQHVEDAEVTGGNDNHLAVSLAPLGSSSILQWHRHRIPDEDTAEQKFIPEIINQRDFIKEAVGLVSYFRYVSYNAENFGHFLSDELFPAYSMLEAFDELDYNVQMIRHELKEPLQWSCDYQLKNWGPVQGKKCMFRYKQLSHLFTANEVITVKNYTRDMGGRNHHPICFRKVAAGMGMLADHCEDGIGHGRKSNTRHDCNQGRQATLYNFRRYVMHNIGIRDVLPKKNRVIIWDRDVKDYKAERKIFGLSKLKKRIEESLNIEVMLFVTWHGKPIKYQIKEMSRSTIFITGPGSGSFISWFLPRGSTQIRLYPEWFKMEWFLFNYMPHMHVEHINCKGGHFDEDVIIDVETYLPYIMKGVNHVCRDPSKNCENMTAWHIVYSMTPQCNYIFDRCMSET